MNIDLFVIWTDTDHSYMLHPYCSKLIRTNTRTITVSISEWNTIHVQTLLTSLFIFLSPYPGPIWREAWSFRLPGTAGPPQRHPQANTGEKPGRGQPQWRRFRLRHQFFWDGSRQPGQLPALTPWIVLDLKPGQALKTKGPFFLFCLQWRNKITEENATPTFKALVSPRFSIGIKLLLYGCCTKRRNCSALLTVKNKHHPLVKCWQVWPGATYLCCHFDVLMSKTQVGCPIAW